MLQRQQERVKTTQSTTVNYDLPLWDGQEVTSWMTQMNDAMDKIDSAMWENKTGIDNEKEAVENANQAAADANQKLSELSTWQTTIEGDVDSASKDAAQAKGDAAQALQGAANATMEVQALQEIVDTQGDDIDRLAGEIETAGLLKGAKLFTISQNHGGVDITFKIAVYLYVSGNNVFLQSINKCTNTVNMFNSSTVGVWEYNITNFDTILNDIQDMITKAGITTTLPTYLLLASSCSAYSTVSNKEAYYMLIAPTENSCVLRIEIYDTNQDNNRFLERVLTNTIEGTKS